MTRYVPFRVDPVDVLRLITDVEFHAAEKNEWPHK